MAASKAPVGSVSLDELKQLSEHHASSSVVPLTLSAMNEAVRKASAVLLSHAASSKQAKNNFRGAYAVLSAVKKRVEASTSQALIVPFFDSLLKLAQRLRSVSQKVIVSRDLCLLCRKNDALEGEALNELATFFWGMLHDAICALCSGLHPNDILNWSPQNREWEEEVRKNVNVVLHPAKYYFSFLASFSASLPASEWTRARDAICAMFGILSCASLCGSRGVSCCERPANFASFDAQEALQKLRETEPLQYLIGPSASLSDTEKWNFVALLVREADSTHTRSGTSASSAAPVAQRLSGAASDAGLHGVISEPLMRLGRLEVLTRVEFSHARAAKGKSVKAAEKEDTANTGPVPALPSLLLEVPDRALILARGLMHASSSAAGSLLSPFIVHSSLATASLSLPGSTDDEAISDAKAEREQQRPLLWTAANAAARLLLRVAKVNFDDALATLAIISTYPERILVPIKPKQLSPPSTTQTQPPSPYHGSAIAGDFAVLVGQYFIRRCPPRARARTLSFFTSIANSFKAYANKEDVNSKSNGIGASSDNELPGHKATIGASVERFVKALRKVPTHHPQANGTSEPSETTVPSFTDPAQTQRFPSCRGHLDSTADTCANSNATKKRALDEENYLESTPLEISVRTQDGRSKVMRVSIIQQPQQQQQQQQQQHDTRDPNRAVKVRIRY